MPTYKTTGIVLRRFNLGEADRIIVFLTPDLGKVKAVARGVRKIKSRMAGHLELFAESDLMLAKGRNLDVITSVKLRTYHQSLSEDWGRLSAAYLAAEMLDRLVAEDVESTSLYRLARVYLDSLATDGPTRLSELYFKLRLLDSLGYRPSLDGCSVCGEKRQAEKYFFNPVVGGIVDQSCRTAEGVPMTLEAIKLWRLALDKELTYLAALKGAEGAAAGSLDICDAFYLHLFGTPFKTNQILKI